MTVNRRILQLPLSDVKRAKEIAAESGLSLSALVRGWIEDFIKEGTTLRPEPRGRIQVIIDPDLARRADEKAQQEYGLQLHRVISHRVTTYRPKRKR